MDDAAPSPQIPDNRDSTARPQSTTPSQNTNASERRCFICLGDSSEAETPTDWVTPCTCALEGHQHCMLTWVADLESQNKEIKCPLCKSKIHVEDRWDPAIQLGDSLTRVFSRWSPTFLLVLLGSSATVSSGMYGLKMLEVFAGSEAAMNYLVEKPVGLEWAQLMGRGASAEPALNSVHLASLTLIAPALVLNRMHLGDIVITPISLLYSMLFYGHKDEVVSWPPSPRIALAVYPAIKTIYFHLYRDLVGELEKKWEKLAVRPRTVEEENAERVAAREDDLLAEEAGEGENLIDIQIDLEIGGDDDNGGGNDAPVQNRVLNAAGRSPFNFLAGAWLWPVVSYGVGEMMRHILPKAWVTKPASRPITGLLQERWGRSLIGGCLFVVLKDAFFLYVKYRRAMNRPFRRIRNRDRRDRGT